MNYHIIYSKIYIVYDPVLSLYEYMSLVLFNEQATLIHHLAFYCTTDINMVDNPRCLFFFFACTVTR